MLTKPPELLHKVEKHVSLMQWKLVHCQQQHESADWMKELVLQRKSIEKALKQFPAIPISHGILHTGESSFVILVS